MNKKIASLLLFFGLLLLGTRQADASLVVIETNGTVQINVLAAEKDISLLTPSPNVKLDKITDNSANDTALVRLNSADGKVNLDIYDGTGTKTLNVTDYEDNVLEVMERPDVQRLEISLKGDKFQINNNGTIALTSLPITVDSKSAELSVETNNGDANLSIFPSEAVQTALRTKFLTKVNAEGVEIISDGSQLQYKISGDKVVHILNLYDYSIPISSYISASSGEVLKIDAPGWLKFVNFLFA